MKILSALLATFLYSANATAGLEFTFSGNFVNAGNISGQLNLEVLSSDPSNFQYSLSAPPSILVDNQPFNIGNSDDKTDFDVVLNVVDNLTISDAEIVDRGFTNDQIKPGTYDFLVIHIESKGNVYENGALKSGGEFSALAFFDQNELGVSDLLNPNFQGVFGLSSPIYSVFEIRKISSSENFRGTGSITASNIVDTNVFTPVPLPGAVWLFGSVIAGLGLRMRKQA